MKYLKYIVFAGLVGVVAWACTDDTVGPVLHKNGGLAITSPANGDVVELKEANATQPVTITWSPADYGFQAATSYRVELDKAGNNFAEPAVLANVTSTSASISQGDLNNILLAKELEGESPSQVDIRVIATVSPDVAPDESAVVTFTVIPYSSTVVIPQLGVPGSYQGWAPSDSTTAVYSPKSNGLYEGYVNFNIDNAFFKYTVRTWISDHQCSKIVFMFQRFFFQIFNVNKAFFGAFYHHYFHARHDGAGRIGAMSRNGYQYNIAVWLFPVFMICPDGK